MASPKYTSPQQEFKRCPFCHAIMTNKELQRHVDLLHTEKPIKQNIQPIARVIPPLSVQTANQSSLHYGTFQLNIVGENRPLVLQKTMRGVRSNGLATVFIAADQQGSSLEIAYVAWDNQEREIRTLAVISPFQAVRLLEGGRRRLGIYSHPADSTNHIIELSQALINGNGESGWSNLFLASQADLDTGSGLDVFTALSKLGTLQIGTKAQLLQEESKRRNFLCAIFPAKQVLVPVVAFLLTRVLPLQNGMTKDG